MTTGRSGLSLATLIVLFGSCNGDFQESVIYPIIYPARTIDLGISINELNVPTGKCRNTRTTDLSLILPRSCPPRILYSGFIVSDRVTCLSLRDNLIEGASIGSFDRLPNLRYLDLSKNLIDPCDILSFGNHDGLTTLIVDENRISSEIGTTIERSSYFPRVEHLYLRNNRIRELRLSLGRNFPSLAHLYLSDNRLDSASLDNLDVPITLRHLYLERNNIRRVKSRLIRELRTLFLDGNKIGKICSTERRGQSCVNLRGTTKLRFLSLSRNEIDRIDRDSFADSCDLQSLSISHNRLDAIAYGTFDGLRELRDLSLSHNRLTCAPIFDHSRKLTTLSLDHNEIEIIESSTFRGLASLKWMTLSGNRIGVIESGAFRDLEMLEELDLSYNELSYFSPGWIGSNTRLRLLDLRGNRFTSYHNLYLYDVVTLIDLYMQGNPLLSLATPPQGTFSHSVNVHTEHGITYSPSPCYVICDFETQALTRLQQSYY